MQIVRTIVWVLLLAALLIFSFANWAPTITVYIWEGLIVETKIPAIVIVSFLIGFVPMWLMHRGTKWHFNRRIASLESALRTATEASAVSATATPAEEPLYADPVAERPVGERDIFLRDADTPPNPPTDNPETPRP